MSLAERKEEGVLWYTGVLLGAEMFMASWHKSQEEAINSRLREVNRAAKALLANQKTKTKERQRNDKEREETRRRREAGREREREREGNRSNRKGASSNKE